MPRKDKGITPKVTQKLQDLGYNVADWDDSQTSEKLTDSISKVLKNSSKSQNGKIGYPDRIYCNKNEQLLILVEEKSSVENHYSNNIKVGCIAGLKWYLSLFLSDEFKSWKILGIAVSGNIDDKYNHEFDCFIIENKQIHHLKNVKNFLTEHEFISLFNNFDEEKAIENLTKVSKRINKLLRSVDSQKRPIILASLMISLYKTKKYINNFSNIYNQLSSEQIIHNLYPTIKNILISEGIPDEKLEALKLELEAINQDQSLKNTSILKQILNELQNEVIPLFNNSFSTRSNYDIVGKFYEEFLRYAGISNVKKGIVLTPRHITGLFTKLVPLKNNDVILDLCCGTGAFLIAAMNKLLSLNGIDVDNVKTNQLLGFEINTTMYICAISNMLFRGDGKSKIYNMDSINNPEVDKIIQEMKPTIGFINPPYSGKESQEDPTPKEITFLKKLLDVCSRYVVIIAPLSMYFKDAEIRKKILDKHTLKYVLNMPKDLFQPNASTSTAIAVFETHKCHDFSKNVILYDLQDDGFILSKNKGRTDIFNKWDDIESELLDELFNGNTSNNTTISRVKLRKNSEWNIYAYSNPNYKALSNADFLYTINEYLVYQIKKKLNILDVEKSEFELSNIISNFLKSRSQMIKETSPVSLFENQNWEFFNIEVVFDRIEPTKGTKTYELIDGYDIPYIAAKKKNNGFDYFVSKDSNEEFISKGNGIVFIHLGDGSAGYSTYQEDDFIGMNGKTSVGYSKYLNKYTALFLITILDKHRYKYSFGRSWSGQRFKQTKLYLPCTKSGQIDWKFMEKYIYSLSNGNIL